MATVTTNTSNIFSIGVSVTASATPTRLEWVTADGYTLVATGASVFTSIETSVSRTQRES